jgi:hypothetical protein
VRVVDGKQCELAPQAVALLRNLANPDCRPCGLLALAPTLYLATDLSRRPRVAVAFKFRASSLSFRREAPPQYTLHRPIPQTAGL